MCGAQRVTWMGWFSPSSVWVLKIESRETANTPRWPCSLLQCPLTLGTISLSLIVTKCEMSCVPDRGGARVNSEIT